MNLRMRSATLRARADRSEEHTSELQSRLHLVCRLLLEKNKIHHTPPSTSTPLQTAPLHSHLPPNRPHHPVKTTSYTWKRITSPWTVPYLDALALRPR